MRKIRKRSRIVFLTNGGLQTNQVKRLKEMEKENHRLRRAVSDLTLDNQILQEVVRGKCSGGH